MRNVLGGKGGAGSSSDGESGGRSLPPSSIAVLEHRYHLDQPFLAQYWYWLTGALHA